MAKDLENIAVLSAGRLPSRATMYPYAREEAALTFQRELSPYFKLLSGVWAFRYAENAGGFSPAEVLDTSAVETLKWDETPVPSCWQMQGYGRNQYTNIQVCIDSFCQCHRSCMTDNLFDRCLIDSCFC